jgi:BolA protein
MNINKLISIIQDKIKKNIILQEINIEDKTFLHKKHPSHIDGKFHLKIIISSVDLKKLSKIESTKKIYSILNEELKMYIHSIQILIQ